MSTFVKINSIFPTDVEQPFLVERPQNISVGIGQTAVIRCFVGQHQGRVMWAKDGFPLRSDQLTPHKPRSIIGREEFGEHFLKIDNVTMEDSAEYQCMVLAHGEQGGIRAVAHLTVLIEPASVNDGSVSTSICVLLCLFSSVLCIFN